MKMAFELLLLCALIFIFLISFCGLIQKIRQSYERERLIADRVLRQRQATSASLPQHIIADAYGNTAFVIETDSGIFPGSPPPYSQICAPPKYDDIIKDRPLEVVSTTEPRQDTEQMRSSAPPPYTIAVI